MGDGIGRQVAEIAVGAGPLRCRCAADCSTFWPIRQRVAVQQVVGEFLAEGDVGGDAAVEEVTRVGRQEGRQFR